MDDLMKKRMEPGCLAPRHRPHARRCHWTPLTPPGAVHTARPNSAWLPHQVPSASQNRDAFCVPCGMPISVPKQPCSWGLDMWRCLSGNPSDHRCGPAGGWALGAGCSYRRYSAPAPAPPLYYRLRPPLLHTLSPAGPARAPVPRANPHKKILGQTLVPPKCSLAAPCTRASLLVHETNGPSLTHSDPPLRGYLQLLIAPAARQPPPLANPGSAACHSLLALFPEIAPFAWLPLPLPACTTTRCPCLVSIGRFPVCGARAGR